jgi:hypothetical protein
LDHSLSTTTSGVPMAASPGCRQRTLPLAASIATVPSTSGYGFPAPPSTSSLESMGSNSVPGTSPLTQPAGAGSARVHRGAPSAAEYAVSADVSWFST